MESKSIISAIDAEIAKLEQVRALLANGGKVNPMATRKATKKLSVKQAAKRTMSPEARKRIADAQRKRWAATKKQTSASEAKTTKKAVKRTVSTNPLQRTAE